MWESQAVQRCLGQFGWSDPRWEPAKAEERAIASPTSHEAPINEPREQLKETGTKPEANLLITQEQVSSPTVPMCPCGAASSGILNGTPACPRHYLIRLGLEPNIPGEPEPEVIPLDRVVWKPNPESHEERAIRLVMEEEANRVILGGTESSPHVDPANLFPGISEDNLEFWRQQDAEREAEHERQVNEYERHLARERDAAVRAVSGNYDFWNLPPGSTK